MCDVTTPIQQARQVVRTTIPNGSFLIWLFPFLLLICACSTTTSQDVPTTPATLVTSLPTAARTPSLSTPAIADGLSSTTPGLDVPKATGPSMVMTATITPADRVSATPTPAERTTTSPDEVVPIVESAPAPAPVGTVIFYEESVTLPTYPFERYQTDEIDPQYNWPYKRFDIERFRAESPTPEPRTYRLLVLENAYLKLSIMPEMGGRIWQVIHKATGDPIFYQNSVVKPTHWGIADQLGWLALGGIEWSLPVVEHGYDWGTPWGYIPLQYSEDLAAVTVFTPSDGRLLTASITISLRAGAASFDIEPTLTNLADHDLTFSFWHDAMLAPGSGKHPSAALRFILPTDQVRLHSTNDAALPAPGQTFSWPINNGRDFSQLGNYRQYLGFFEAPAAHGPFVAVYDPGYDIGVVRIFPPEIARGNKIFTLGWQDALESSNFTDDDSAYVEMHGGLAPTFDEQYQLPAAGVISWREVWYPVTGIATVSDANELAALAATVTGTQLQVGIYGTRPVDGTVVVAAMDTTAAATGEHNTPFDRASALATLPFQARPDAPFRGTLSLGAASAGSLIVQLQDSSGRVLLTHISRIDP